MRVLSIAIICHGILAASLIHAGEHIDWGIWRALPVQWHGRIAPLDTVARESLRSYSDRTHFFDSRTGEDLDATAWYVTMLFDWSGWDNRHRGPIDVWSADVATYFRLGPADHWDQAPLIQVDSTAMRAALSLPVETHAVSPEQLSRFRIEDPQAEQEIPFPPWADALLARQQNGDPLRDWERVGWGLVERIASYQRHRTGAALILLPKSEGRDGWMSFAELAYQTFDDANDPSGQYRSIQQLIQNARSAWLRRDTATFNRISRQLVEEVRTADRALDHSRLAVVLVELWYYRWTPFRWAGVFMLIAAGSSLLSRPARTQWLLPFGAVAYGVATVAIVLGIVARTWVAQRLPLPSLFDSTIAIGAGATLLGVIFARVFRHRLVLATAASVASLAFLVAELFPGTFDPAIRPGDTELGTSPFLSAQLLALPLACSALALAWGAGNLALGLQLLASPDVEGSRVVSRFTYQALHIGTFLLAAASITRGFWADQARGRAWSWDPKEVWILIALLGYLAGLQACQVGWIGRRNLAVFAIVALAPLVMAWWGVSSPQAAIFHRSGYLPSSVGVLVLLSAVQALFVSAAWCRRVWFSPVCTS